MFDHISFIEEQTAGWPLAADNYRRLGETERRVFRLGDLPVAVQYNPARMVSTAARVDSSGRVEDRPCFLCASNRPPQQRPEPLIEGWDLLLNPYPVFPVHFTIVRDRHVPQANIPAEAAYMAALLPGMTVFYNGARAGASAPDHLHCQAVLTDELPLMQLVMRHHPVSREGVENSSSWGLDLPFEFWSAVIGTGDNNMRDLYRMVYARGVDAKTGVSDFGLVNAYFWLDPSGVLRVVVVPRSAHRPDCYYAGGDAQYLVSPGALEMAGIVVVPRREDFDRIGEDTLRAIYAQTAFPPSALC